MRSIATVVWSTPSDPVTSAHRLALVDTARLALRNTLGLLGISTPEQM